MYGFMAGEILTKPHFEPSDGQQLMVAPRTQKH
jgi:hypothetical protein